MNTHVADTGYILSFLATPDGRYLLQDLSYSLGVTQAVRAELDELESNRPNARAGARAAAARFNADPDAWASTEDFLTCDRPERDLALMHIAAQTIPDDPPDDVVSSDDDCVEPHTVGDNAGEAESIAVCVRNAKPLMMNDLKATPYAESRGVDVESAADSLLRLYNGGNSQELFSIVKLMESAGSIGAVVPGHLWFRQ